MDAFRTTVEAPEFPFSIDHSSNVVMLGSCFAENMGELLRQSKVAAHVNPFGILFNPFSIMTALERMLNGRLYSEVDLLHHADHWISLDHHGRFNGAQKENVLNGINTSLLQGKTALEQADVVFVTLGSAWVYHHITLNHTVANCHKIPNNEFEKRLLSFQDVHLILRHIPQFFKAKGIESQIIFTVSPVRHWKDGAVENQRSKSLLHGAVHAVVDEFESCHYFPAYEIMMDDLRDYRFYAADMLHLSPQAIDYIWQKFQQSFFTDETRIICQELKAVTQAATHRPIDPESNSFQRFLKKQLDIIAVLESKYPQLDLAAEKIHFEGYLL